MARYEIPIVKGNSDVFNRISSAADCIEGGLYEVAEERLDKALEIISTSEPSTDQETSIARSIRDDVEWLKAISLMKQGKVFKSRKALKAIASSNSFLQRRG